VAKLRPVRRVSRNRDLVNFPDTLGKVPISQNPIADATALFIEKGAQAAWDSFGNPLRAKILMPRVMARTKYLERSAKRLYEAHMNPFVQPDRPVLPVSL